MYIIKHFINLIISFFKRIFTVKRNSENKIMLSPIDILTPFAISATGVLNFFTSFNLTYIVLVFVSLGSIFIAIMFHILESKEGYCIGGIFLPLLTFTFFMYLDSSGIRFHKNQILNSDLKEIESYHNGLYKMYEFKFQDNNGNERILRKRSNDFYLLENGRIIVE